MTLKWSVHFRASSWIIADITHDCQYGSHFFQRAWNSFQGSRSCDAWLTLSVQRSPMWVSRVNHITQLSWFLVSSFPLIKWARHVRNSVSATFCLFENCLRTLDNAYQCFFSIIFLQCFSNAFRQTGSFIWPSLGYCFHAHVSFFIKGIILANAS